MATKKKTTETTKKATTKKTTNKVKAKKADNGGDNIEFLKLVGGDLYKEREPKKEFVFDVMRTRFTSLNRASGAGGILTGGIWELYGLSHGGKSALGIGILGDAQRQGHLTMFADGERSDNDDRWTSALGWEKSKGLYFRPKHFENCRATVNKTINNFLKNQRAGKIPKDKKLFILVDSVPTLIPKDCLLEAEKEDTTSRFGKTALLMSEWLPVLLTMVGDDDDNPSNVTVLFINQMRQKIGAGLFEEKYKTYGGEALPFYAQVRVKVTKTGDIKKSIKGVMKKVGKEHKITFMKCKVGVGEEAKFFTSNGKGDCKLGFDVFKEVMEEGIYRGIIEKSGKTIECDYLDQTWKDEKTARNYFDENPDEFEKLIDHLNNSTTETDEGDEE